MTQSLPNVPRQQHTWRGLEGVEVFTNSDKAIENARVTRIPKEEKKELEQVF